MIPEEWVDFIEGGVGAALATRDPSNGSECVRVCGARVHADRRGVTVFVPTSWAGRTAKNLEATGEAAAIFSSPISYRSYQVKGRYRTVRRATEEEREVQQRIMRAFQQQLELIWMPPILAAGMPAWPALAVEIEARETYVQTPGPTAGRRDR